MKIDDLSFYLRLKDDYLKKNATSKWKSYLYFYFTKVLGLFSEIYKDIYNIYIFRDLSGNRVGFIHLSNLHLFKITGSYKSFKKKYLELYSVDDNYKGKKYGSTIIRTVQGKIYPDSRIFGIIRAKNQKALLSANRTGRKVYSALLKYSGLVKEINLSENSNISKNITISKFIHGRDESVLYKIYKSKTPDNILLIENLELKDFYLTKFDRLISAIHKRLSDIIEDIFGERPNWQEVKKMMREDYE